MHFGCDLVLIRKEFKILDFFPQKNFQEPYPFYSKVFLSGQSMARRPAEGRQPPMERDTQSCFQRVASRKSALAEGLPPCKQREAEVEELICETLQKFDPSRDADQSLPPCNFCSFVIVQDNWSSPTDN